MIKPKARVKNLLTETVGDELVVYDQERKTAHRLNKTAATVWRHCDGINSVTEIVQHLQSELNEAADENLVLLSLDRLQAVHLMEESVKLTSQQTRTSRREFVRKVGTVGILSVLLPLITTLTVPTAAQAQTCSQSAGTTGTIACSGLCQTAPICFTLNGSCFTSGFTGGLTGTLTAP
jgi:hypothetical protein